ncbi:MAG TPA: hypothetical protein VKC34_00970 [Blastocatellia bacterium]|nr:hypothetical protein [Blastocatellia bacterium]
MATKALTNVAPRAGRDQVSPKAPPEHVRGWREILIEEDADAIWRKLSHLMHTGQSEGRPIPDRTVQELFLHMLSSGRFRAYVELGYSEEEINQDVLACMPD